MARLWFVLPTVVLLLVSCVRQTLPPPEVEAPAEPVSFIHDVKPVLDTRCVVCHSCYNAACQLKMTSFEGVDRGGSKDVVYSSTRISDQAPTRLFLDAQSTEAWRNKGFHSVTERTGPGPEDASVMAWFLEAKHRNPVPEGSYHPEATDLTCAANPAEARTFLDKHPSRGMPLGFPALTDADANVLQTWLAQGAPGPDAVEQAALVSPSPAGAAEIAKWEAFLNDAGPKTAMTARYLYEHFFLAHLRFGETGENVFYRLVRSRTPSGQAVVPIATVRPYDDPGVEQVYYRFEKVHSTIMLKTHMVVELDDRRMERYRELFLEPDWLETPHLMPYDDRDSANPFVVYAQIPPRSRYEFLLDHSYYFILTFMRGPVCKGQIALNVINDHFWVMFLDPDADRIVQYPEFLIGQEENLRLPTERGSDMPVFEAFSNAYRKRYKAFSEAKKAFYMEKMPEGPSLDAIWQGNTAADAPFLTIYRHFDSASVVKGAVGEFPRTLWVIDYTQLERIYYALVAGFDVFGNVAHQANVRRYMDYLRMEGELNFLMFMPPEDRLSIWQYWNLGDGVFEDMGQDVVAHTLPTRVQFNTEDPVREFVELVVDHHLLEETGIAFDPVNYLREGERTGMPASFETDEDILNGFRALNAPGTGFIRNMTSSEANVMLVRVRDYDGPFESFTIVINRWHDNVNSLFGESKRLDHTKDTIDFIPGSLGDYPNYFFDIHRDELPAFFDLLENYDGSPEYVARLNRFGINRMEESFWPTYDWFQQRVLSDQPVHGGLYDLNRYYSEARPDAEWP